ncbi:LA2681 family HEPN domain-containing protein [Pseudovibrio sp. POLY-S9]|uniref:LA2681 family HEPN domain-containing protein n=1 Tax=Pseudovibrio sp. POLY-S9 TaxID=1576596 RepID=UPI00070A84A4|nr:LA2681 family HEPN domain-containing protein [Pseudovibrio sp. POLY-S9]
MSLNLVINELLDHSPEKAVEHVRALGSSPTEQKQKADTYIDAGISLNRPYLIRAGILILKKECSAGNGAAAHYYSLANGLSAYSEVYKRIHQSKSQRAKRNSEARSYYGKVLVSEDSPTQLRSQAATNIANHLKVRGRYIEALDYYNEALDIMPRNAVAAVGELSLIDQLRYFIVHEHEWYRFYAETNSLYRRSVFLEDTIRNNLDVLADLAGNQHVEFAQKLIEHRTSFNLPEQTSSQDSYETWVQKNNLALSLFCSPEEYNKKRYDLLSVPSFRGVGISGSKPPDIFRMFNIIKSDYVLARRVLFEASNESFEETANYSDTLDYATYGINVAAMASAQKTALDILEKISVIIACLLDLPSAERFHFKKTAFWRRKKGGSSWELTHKEVLRQIASKNNMMSVFLEIICDLHEDEDGYLSHLTSLRNFTTHRFLSVHDFPFAPEDAEKSHVGHFQQNELLDGAMKSLRLARACMFYLVDFIKRHQDQEQHASDLIMSFDVPDHHWVRGRDI